MQTWEYLEVDADVRHDNPYGWSDSTGRGGELSKGSFSAPICNVLGAQGWELTGAAAVSPNLYRLFFNRPRV